MRRSYRSDFPSLLHLDIFGRIQIIPVFDTLLIGRAQDAGLRIDDPSISLYHGIVYDGDESGIAQPGTSGWRIRDLGSRNGVYLNGAKVRQESPLRDGDVLHVGRSHTLLFTCPQDRTARCRHKNPGDADRVRTRRTTLLR